MMYDAKKPVPGGIEAIELKSIHDEGMAELSVGVSTAQGLTDLRAEVSRGFQADRETAPAPPDLTSEQLKVEVDGFLGCMEDFRELSARIAMQSWSGYRYGGKTPPREKLLLFSVPPADEEVVVGLEEDAVLQVAIQEQISLDPLPLAVDPDGMLWQRLWIQSHEITQAWLHVREDQGRKKDDDPVLISQLPRELRPLILVARSSANLCEALGELGRSSGAQVSGEIDELGQEMAEFAGRMTRIVAYFTHYTRVNPTVTLTEEEQGRFIAEKDWAEEVIRRIQKDGIRHRTIYNMDFFVGKYLERYNYTHFYIRKLLGLYRKECESKGIDFGFKIEKKKWITRSAEAAQGFCDFIENAKRKTRKKRPKKKIPESNELK